MYGALSSEVTPCPGFELGMPALNMRTYTLFETTTHSERLRRTEAFAASGPRSGAFHPSVDRPSGLGEITEAHR